LAASTKTTEAETREIGYQVSYLVISTGGHYRTVLENCSLVYGFVKMFVTGFIILKGDVAWLCDRDPRSVILV